MRIIKYQEMKLSCICPCWGRPERTLRAIESVVNQNFIGYEAIFIGDRCPIFQKYLDNEIFEKYSKIALSKGNSLIFKNLSENYGGWGYKAREEGIKMAKGQYICFLDNDDVLKPSHFENYFSFMEEDPGAHVGYLNTYINSSKKERISYLWDGGIGHAELIIQANVLKENYILDNEYGHDWKLIKKLIEKGYTFKKSNSPATYVIMGIGDNRERNID